jgi:hypothetical protein
MPSAHHRADVARPHVGELNSRLAMVGADADENGSGITTQSMNLTDILTPVARDGAAAYSAPAL